VQPNIMILCSDTIEANVTSAHDNVEQGRDQLIKAATYQVSQILCNSRTFFGIETSMRREKLIYTSFCMI